MFYLLMLLAGLGLFQLMSKYLLPVRMWLASKNSWFPNKILNLTMVHPLYGVYAGFSVYLLSLLSPYTDVILWGLAISFVGYVFQYLTTRPLEE